MDANNKKGRHQSMVEGLVEYGIYKAGDIAGSFLNATKGDNLADASKWIAVNIGVAGLFWLTGLATSDQRLNDLAPFFLLTAAILSVSYAWRSAMDSNFSPAYNYK